MSIYLTYALATTLLFSVTPGGRQALHAELEMQEVCDQKAVKKALCSITLTEEDYVRALASRCLGPEAVYEAVECKKASESAPYAKTSVLVKGMIRYAQYFYLNKLPQITREADVARRMSEDDDYETIKSRLSTETQKELFHFLRSLGFFSGFMQECRKNFRIVDEAIRTGRSEQNFAHAFQRRRKHNEDFLRLGERLKEVSVPICAELERAVHKDYCLMIDEALNAPTAEKEAEKSEIVPPAQ